MKLKIPFYKAQTDIECGPLALKMVLEYFGETHEIDELSKLCMQTPTGLVWSAGIALGATKLGFEAQFFTKNAEVIAHENAFYERYANDEGMRILKETMDELYVHDITLKEKNMSVKELLGNFTTESIPIVLINWNTLINKEGYQGHFVTVSGYDDKYIYVHNPGIVNATKHMAILKDVFEQAWESEGTDKDVVIIKKKVPQKE
jgi:predicted double-glycine peptidase